MIVLVGIPARNDWHTPRGDEKETIKGTAYDSVGYRNIGLKETK